MYNVTEMKAAVAEPAPPGIACFVISACTQDMLCISAQPAVSADSSQQAPLSDFHGTLSVAERDYRGSEVR